MTSRRGRPGPGRGTGGARAWSGDAGSVTVEAAVALSALLVALVLCLAAIGAAVLQVRLTDAAGAAVRLAARGDVAAAEAAVHWAAGAGAVLRLAEAGDGALVTARVEAVPLSGLLPGLRLSAQAVAAREPSEGS